MDAAELLEEWREGMRPQRVQRVRDDLARVTGLSVPQRVSVIESWLNENEEDVTQALEESVEEEGE